MLLIFFLFFYLFDFQYYTKFLSFFFFSILRNFYLNLKSDKNRNKFRISTHFFYFFLFFFKQPNVDEIKTDYMKNFSRKVLYSKNLYTFVLPKK